MKREDSATAVSRIKEMLAERLTIQRRKKEARKQGELLRLAARSKSAFSLARTPKEKLPTPEEISDEYDRVFNAARDEEDDLEARRRLR